LFLLPLLSLAVCAAATQMSMAGDQNTTLYFGYGSNLWLQQMKLRCPTSQYVGVARLNGYRWMINERGYANVVETPTTKGSTFHVPTTNVTYALVYILQTEDERRLDSNEGVPVAYTKETLSVDFWPASGDDRMANVTHRAEKRDMLVYINRKQIRDSAPKKEYIYRLNKGIKDAVAHGVPQDYVDESIRPFIPARSDADIREQAERQALFFKDER